MDRLASGCSSAAGSLSVKSCISRATYHVKVIANDFGSYIPYAPRQSRLHRVSDIRRVMEKYKIGWAMWECDEGFGWMNYPYGNRNSPVVDNEVLQALGLK